MSTDWSNFENYYKRLAKRVWIYFFLFNQWLHRGISVILPFVWMAIFPNAFTLPRNTFAFRRRPQKAKLTTLKSSGHKSRLVVDELTSQKSTATSSKSGILEHSIVLQLSENVLFAKQDRVILRAVDVPPGAVRICNSTPSTCSSNIYS